MQFDVTLRAIRIRSLVEPIRLKICKYFDTADINRCTSLRTLADQWRYLSGRKLSYFLLEKTLGISIQNLKRGQHGRPEIENSLCDVNIAHTKNLIVGAAVKRGRIGIDVEYVDAFNDHSSIVFDFLNNDELLYFQSLSSSVRKEEAVKFWVVKEAIIKCDGIGFGINPKLISIEKGLAEDQWYWHEKFKIYYKWRCLHSTALIGLAYDPGSMRLLSHYYESTISLS